MWRVGVGVCSCIYVCIYICIVHMCIYLCICVCVYLYTHTHILGKVLYCGKLNLIEVGDIRGNWGTDKDLWKIEHGSNPNIKLHKTEYQSMFNVMTLYKFSICYFTDIGMMYDNWSLCINKAKKPPTVL